MIVYKNNWFCTNSDHPNEDWVGDADYVVEDGSDLARKILEYAPNFSLVTDKDNGTLIDVIPTEITAAELDKYKALTKDIIMQINDNYTFHDFKMVKGPTHTNLIFDLVVPYENDKTSSQILKELDRKFKEKDETISLVVTVEHSYV